MVSFTQTPILAIALGALSVSAYYGPPKTTCPKKNDGTAKCKASDGKVYTALLPGNNPCWTGAKGFYICQAPNKADTCPTSAVDIRTCEIPKPACPNPNMPKISCTGSNGNDYPFDNPNPFSCWYKKGDKWGCEEKKSSTCPNGMLEVSGCEINKPSCPDASKPEATCFHKGALYTFDNPGKNFCWYKQGEGEGSYLCEPREVDGNCSRGTVDVGSCPIDYPITPCPKLFYNNEVCKTSDGKTLRLDQMKLLGAPVCWSATKPYSCNQPRLGSCRAGHFNVGTCKPRPPYGYSKY